MKWLPQTSRKHWSTSVVDRSIYVDVAREIATWPHTGCRVPWALLLVDDMRQASDIALYVMACRKGTSSFERGNLAARGWHRKKVDCGMRKWSLLGSGLVGMRNAMRIFLVHRSGGLHRDSRHEHVKIIATAKLPLVCQCQIMPDLYRPIWAGWNCRGTWTCR